LDRRALGIKIQPTSSSLLPVLAALGLLVLGVAGKLNAGWGYGLLLVAALTLGFGVIIFSIFVFTHRFDSASLRASFVGMFRLGGWSYVLAVSALSGYYINETIAGRMEAKWIVFGPVALAAIIFLDWGVYRLVVRKNLPTWARFGHLVSRSASDPAAMRRTLVDDVVLHKALFSVSGFRWFKHTLIFWGFSLMFATELIAAFVRELPAFGMRDVWSETANPIRLAFDFVYDFSGLMILIGCVLALIWRVVVNGKPEQQFSDTPTAAFLFVVAFTGFVLEAIRIAAVDPTSVTHTASFVGLAMAQMISAPDAVYGLVYEPLWLFHVLISCVFIAYVPVKRLIHSCATPVGRLMNSQKGLLAAKKMDSLNGMLIRDKGD
jgi:nitrate reductase gamma subunit